MKPANQLELFSAERESMLIGKTLKSIFSLALNHSIRFFKASIFVVLNLPLTKVIVLIKPSVEFIL